MVQAYASEHTLPPVVESTVVESSESFNILCAGESGLGKSTFLRDVFAHLDPTKLQNHKKSVSDAAARVAVITEDIRRNEHESKNCSDERARELRTARGQLKEKLIQAQNNLDAAQHEFHQHQRSVQELQAQVHALEDTIRALRTSAREEPDDAEATRLLDEVLEKGKALAAARDNLSSELRKDNLDKEKVGRGQTTEVKARLIPSMPLFEGAHEALDVTLIDTPGYGDLRVDHPNNSSADKVVAEVERRITRHLAKEVASRADLSLVDEKKYWNELVHLCFFFISPHMMKRADVELMKRLHTLVPLVVVIAKSDTMTVDETRDFKDEVSHLLKEQGVHTFVFSQDKRTAVEDQHKAQVADDTFEPLYGGSTGDHPWAVMGADFARRHTLIGTWETDNPRHSDLPAVRDLVLRAGGWKDLKTDAAIKAEDEGLRRRDAEERERQRRAGENAWQRLVKKPLAALRRPSRLELLMALMALVASVLLPTAAARQRDPLERQLAALHSEHRTCVHSRESLQRHVEALSGDYDHCTQVRKAVEEDLAQLQLKVREFKAGVKPKDSWWQWQ